jgi:outer membrane lipoprotein SlyB
MAASISRFLSFGLALAGLSACGPNYSPDTYASSAVQQANKVEQGTVVGVRKVGVSAAGTVGTITGAATGGIAGAQAVAGPAGAFTSIGGALVGGIAGSTAEHVTADSAAFEYIVRKPNGDLVSVTQNDKTPLALGQKVLVIAGNQARVVPDYTVPPDITAAKSHEAAKPVEAAKPAEPAAPAEAAKPPEPAAPPEAAKPATPPEAVKPAEAAKPIETVNPGAPPLQEFHPAQSAPAKQLDPAMP